MLPSGTPARVIGGKEAAKVGRISQAVLLMQHPQLGQAPMSILQVQKNEPRPEIQTLGDERRYRASARAPAFGRSRLRGLGGFQC